MEFMPASGLLYYAVGNTYLANKQPADASKGLSEITSAFAENGE